MNRSGNRPSHDGAAGWIDKAITLCLEGGFRSVTVRGDTDFSQTEHLDRWDEQEVDTLGFRGKVRFEFSDFSQKIATLNLLSHTLV